MTLSQVGRILVLAAIFTATPAIAANQSVAPSYGPYYYSPRNLSELYIECNNRPSELETRACFSRLLTEANDRLDWAYDRLERIVERYEPADQADSRSFRSYEYHAEKLIGARSSWEAFADYHCDFEGAILGSENTAESIENMICRIMTINYHAERLLALADVWNPADLPPNAGGGNDDDNTTHCDTVTNQSWEVTCDDERRYYARTRANAGELRVIPDGLGGYDLLVIDSSGSIDRSTPVDIRIDRGSARQFSPSGDPYGSGRDRGIMIRHSPSVDRLIADMRQGSTVEIVYRDGAGQLTVAQFSLMGLTRSLEWVSSRRGGFRPTSQR